MNRRTILRRGLAVSLVAVAGCAGSSELPNPLIVASRGYHFTPGGSQTESTAGTSGSGSNGESGPLVVTTVVSNVSDRRHAATLVFDPAIDGETRKRTTDVELAAHQTAVFSTTYADVTQGSMHSLHVYSHLRDVR